MYYELDKAFRSQRKTEERFDAVEQNTTKFTRKLDVAKSDMNRITALQQSNRRQVEELEAQVAKLELQLQEKLRLLDAKNLNSSTETTGEPESKV